MKWDYKSSDLSEVSLAQCLYYPHAVDCLPCK